MHLSHVVETIDTHTAGNPTRNLIAGVPRIAVSYTHLTLPTNSLV